MTTRPLEYDPFGDTVAILTFRGDRSRSFYGTGEIPADSTAPVVRWRAPEASMCAVGVGSPKCGTGWPGQPIVFPYRDRTWIVFGGFDGELHFIDADSGAEILEPLVIGAGIQSTPTFDRDGYPLLYVGANDGALRIVAIDAPQARVLWQSPASAGPQGSAWTSSPIVLDDHLITGTPSGDVMIAKLDRARSADGLATVDPEMVFRGQSFPGARLVGSVAVRDTLAYFIDSLGVAHGWDLSPVIESGDPPLRILEYPTGISTEATVALDEHGFVLTPTVALDRRVPDDPFVWSVPAPTGSEVWSSSPAVSRGLVISVSPDGEARGISATTGRVRWTIKVPGPVRSSPVIVGDVWLQGDCSGQLHAYDLRDRRSRPRELWTVDLGACVESTPVVWDGVVYIGTSDGHVVALGDPALASSSEGG